MSIVIIILLAIAGVLILFLIIAALTRKNYHAQTEIIINAPLTKVFDYLKHIKNQDYFNKWVMVDPAMKKEFRGTDGTAGFVYVWNGNKQAGEGEHEIKAIEEGKKIETEVRFVRPMPGIAYGKFVTSAISPNETRVIWSNDSQLKYPINIMVPMIEKMLMKDMDTSLHNLKKILEK